MDTIDCKPSVLIVDDDIANIRLLCTLLEPEGYELRSALCAEDALGVLQTFRPQLILMDIQLPGMDGLELTRKLKADEPTRSITIVACSGYPLETMEQEIRDAGCDGYIAKPINPKLLLQRIATYLQRVNAQ